MFSLPWCKKKIAIKEEVANKNIDIKWLEQCLLTQEGLPRPDWVAVQRYVDDHFSEEDQSYLWNEIVREWMRLLMQGFAGDYRAIESDNFILISPADESYNVAMSKHLEYCRRRILHVSKGITSDEGYGKFVVIIFEDVEAYYQYVSYFYGPCLLYTSPSPRD